MKFSSEMNYNANPSGNAFLMIDSDGVSAPQRTKINDILNILINGAPGTLDTLGEIANALGQDPNFATTIINLLGQKINASEKGANNGVATLDFGGKIPLIQLPNPLPEINKIISGTTDVSVYENSIIANMRGFDLLRFDINLENMAYPTAHSTKIGFPDSPYPLIHATANNFIINYPNSNTPLLHADAGITTIKSAHGSYVYLSSDVSIWAHGGNAFCFTGSDGDQITTIGLPHAEDPLILAKTHLYGTHKEFRINQLNSSDPILFHEQDSNYGRTYISMGNDGDPAFEQVQDSNNKRWYTKINGARWNDEFLGVEEREFYGNEYRTAYMRIYGDSIVEAGHTNWQNSYLTLSRAGYCDLYYADDSGVWMYNQQGNQFLFTNEHELRMEIDGCGDPMLLFDTANEHAVIGMPNAGSGYDPLIEAKGGGYDYTTWQMKPYTFCINYPNSGDRLLYNECKSNGDRYMGLGMAGGYGDNILEQYRYTDGNSGMRLGNANSNDCLLEDVYIPNQYKGTRLCRGWGDDLLVEYENYQSKYVEIRLCTYNDTFLRSRIDTNNWGNMQVELTLPGQGDQMLLFDGYTNRTVIGIPNSGDPLIEASQYHFAIYNPNSSDEILKSQGTYLNDEVRLNFPRGTDEILRYTRNGYNTNMQLSMSDGNDKLFACETSPNHRKFGIYESNDDTLYVYRDWVNKYSEFWAGIAGDSFLRMKQNQDWLTNDYSQEFELSHICESPFLKAEFQGSNPSKRNYARLISPEKNTVYAEVNPQGVEIGMNGETLLFQDMSYDGSSSNPTDIKLLVKYRGTQYAIPLQAV